MERPRSVVTPLTGLVAGRERPDAEDQTRFLPLRVNPAPAAASDSDNDMSGDRPHWSRFIQNESYVPPPTPYSPRAPRDEDPLVEQERRCRDKLQALRAARDRFRFFPSTDRQRGATRTARPLRFSTEMVFSSAEAAWARDEREERADASPAPAPHAGVDALGGIEMLLFEFFTSGELLVAGQTCRRWHRLARLDLLWEPRLVTPFEGYYMRDLLGLGRHVPAIQVYMIFRRLKLAQVPYLEEDSVSAAATGGWPLYRRADLRHRALLIMMGDRGNNRRERLHRLLMELRAQNPDGDGALAAVLAPAGGDRADAQQQPTPTLTQAPQPPNGAVTRSILSTFVGSSGQDLFDFDPLASVHLITLPRSTTAAAALSGDTAFPTQAAALPQAAETPARTLQHRVGVLIDFNQPNGPQVNARPAGGAAVAEEEDVFSVVDGRNRVNLSSWLTDMKTVSELGLRSFIRQMLLAVRALKAARVEHIDISLANIIVVLGDTSSCSGASSAESMAEAMDGAASYASTHPLFQLFYNRRSLRAATSHPSEPGLEFAAPRPLGVDVDMEREAAQDVDMLEPRVDDGAPANAAAVLAAAAMPLGLGAGGAGGAHGGLGLFQRAAAGLSMVQSVLNCAVAVWARGRFIDSNTTALLALLLRHPADFPRGLRSFLEYAKFLLMTNAMSVDRLLQHEFVMSASRSAVQSADIVRCTAWEPWAFRDVVEYRTRVLAYYRSVTTAGMVDAFPSSGEAAKDTLRDELAPCTTLGQLFFTRALEETGLATERFVSVVAPKDATSSWIRALAHTQTATLQRLDLSHVHVPPSVILKELAKLPRISHLRLPPQFLRDENLEHLIAALEYSALLPALRATDDTVRVAMDRLERSYTMQLDMVTFLLDKPGGR